MPQPESTRRIRVGVNGFGRIGRCAVRQMLGDERFELRAVNDLADGGDLAYLFAHDSVHGRWPGGASAGDGRLRLGEREIPIHAEREPARIPWRAAGVDVVVEATGVFRARAKAAGHLEAGARRVIVSAPSDDADATLVPGVDLDRYDPQRHRVVSAASCTTNSLAPVAQVLDREFGVEHLFLTTVHAYTSSQALIDAPMRKRRRGRAAALSIVPTTTGAAQATARVLPQLDGRMDGLAMRVPVPCGSISDVVAQLRRDTTVEEVNDAFERAAAAPPLAGILGLSRDELVSQDVVGDPRSAIVDAAGTRLLGGRLVKVLAWYDNEWGYSARLLDVAAHLAEHEP